MSASTFEQIIATHGDMVARHDMRDTNDFTPDEFIDTIASLGQLYATGMTSDLQAASAALARAATYLGEANDPERTNKAWLIALADENLQHVDTLALA